jgi:hypothetical protein
MLVGSVESREKFRVVRLPSTQPISGGEQESVAFFLRGELCRKARKSSGVLAGVIKAQRLQVFRILGLSRAFFRVPHIGEQLVTVLQPPRGALMRFTRAGLVDSTTVLENLTKKRPENSKVLWKTPFAPSLPMTKVMHLTICDAGHRAKFTDAMVKCMTFVMGKLGAKGVFHNTFARQ